MANYFIHHYNFMLLCDFWATVCKTFLSKLSGRFLSVCHVLSVLSVMLVYFSHTVGHIKIKLGMQVGLGRRPQCVRCGLSSPSQKGAQSRNFRPMSVVAKWLDGLRCHLV